MNVYFCTMARIQTEKDVSRKEVILKASAKLFREKGYKAASMRDLAVKVGVEAASLYNHIRSKAELLHDICFNVANVFFIVVYLSVFIIEYFFVACQYPKIAELS